MLRSGADVLPDCGNRRIKTVAFMITVMETQVRHRILRPFKAHWLVHVSSAVWGARRAYSKVYSSDWTSE